MLAKLETINHFDFSQLNSPDFKEDSVREILICKVFV